MHTSLAAQLAQMELGHLRVERIVAVGPAEPPDPDAVAQTLSAIWSDLFALFPDTALEDDAEELAWGLVNLFHRAAAKRSRQIVHGGDGKGVDRLAAAWAESHKVPQVAFGLDSRLGQRAGFRRNEQMLSLNPRCLVAFAGNGVLEQLVIQAKARGIHVVDRRGPLGSNPKGAARIGAVVV